jgi:hypothetical protein
VRNPRMRWVSARSRHDGSPTDTQTDTQSRIPPQGTGETHVVKKTMCGGSGHCHGTVARDAFLKLKQKSEAPQRKPRSHVPTQILMRRSPHPNHTHTHHTNTMVERASRDDDRPNDTQADTQNRSPRQIVTDHCLTS